MNNKEYKWEKIYRSSDQVVTRKIADETIIVPITGNLADMQRLFTVNDVGAAIWKLIDGKRSVNEIKLELLDDFEVEDEILAADIWEFIDDLRIADLILEL